LAKERLAPMLISDDLGGCARAAQGGVIMLRASNGYWLTQP